MQLNDNVQIAVAQAVEIPDFSALPPFAQGVMYTVAAIAVGLSIIVPRMGYLFGKKAEHKQDATVAAVVVDPTALNNHADAIRAQTAANLKLCEVLDGVREEVRVTREVIKFARTSSR